MAKLKLVSDAVTRAQNDFKGIVLATTDALDFANEVNEIVLKAARWDTTLKAGTGFGTTKETQDYDNVPADFLWLKEAWMQDDSTATNLRIPLDVKDSLPSSTLLGRPRALAVELGKFRLFPVPDVTRVTSGQWLIDFEYYKLPTRLTATTSAFEFDDTYFEMFTAGFEARVAQFLDDSRAGEFEGRGRDGAYHGTGFWGKFAAMLNDAIASENRASEEPVVAPWEGLAL